MVLDKLIGKINGKVFPYLKWAGLSFLVAGSSYVLVNKTQDMIQTSQEKNLKTLMYLADQNDSGLVEDDELFEMVEACGVKFEINGESVYVELNNEQIKKGIKYFENKYKK